VVQRRILELHPFTHDFSLASGHSVAASLFRKILVCVRGFFLDIPVEVLVVCQLPVNCLYLMKSLFVFNFFPNQGTQTVRLEEAILGTLSIINILIHNYDKK